jgi:hypothetical protein
MCLTNGIPQKLIYLYEKLVNMSVIRLANAIMDSVQALCLSVKRRVRENAGLSWTFISFMLAPSEHRSACGEDFNREGRMVWKARLLQDQMTELSSML